VTVSLLVTVVLIAGVLIAVGFAAGLVWLRMRGRPGRGPDIPQSMKPGPADEVLERRQLERVMGWGVVFTLFFAAWLPVVWLREPETNVDDELELIARSRERGSLWFQITSEENPTGFGCARCHGEEAQGGVVPFTPEGQDEPVEYPVPSLNDVCGRLDLEEIRTTIEQGREGTPMPSWSVNYEGPMNDQQISDLINYLVSIQTVPPEDNLCLNPPTGTETEPGEGGEGATGATGTEGATGATGATGGGGATGATAPQATPSPEGQ
jgi:cytochrome c553